MQPREYDENGWLKATPQQEELQKPVVKAFLNRLYNNCINNRQVNTGAGLKEGKVRRRK